MPANDYIDKALASAKSALAGAKRFTASTGDTDPSRFAPKPMPKPVAKPITLHPSGLMGEAADAGAGIRERLKTQADVNKQMGSFKKGGTVKKTGVYKLHKGEEVVPAEKSEGLSADLLDKATSALGSMPDHGMRSMHVDHHADGSHTVRHSPHRGEDVTYAVKNNAELHDKIKQYLGEEAAEGE